MSVNIQAHPKRRSQVMYLKKKLGSGARVIWDEKNCVWDTRRRCLEDHIKQGKRYGLTIQDDCLVTSNFYQKVRAFMKEMGKLKGIHSKDLAFNFYLPISSTQQIYSAKRRGYWPIRGMKSGLAICIPTSIMPGIIKMWDGKEELIRHDDSRIGKYLRREGYKTIYPYPSLVQHRDGESLIYKKGEMAFPRKARTYEP